MNETNNSSSFFNESLEKQDLIPFEQHFMNMNSSFTWTKFIRLNEMTVSYNGTNSTAGDWRDTYKPALDLLLLLILIVVMLSMGCDITLKNVKYIFYLSFICFYF